ncbi:MAG: hypothetical protein ACTSV0_04505, partial [Candidatus Freyarchaeota archaeon]
EITIDFEISNVGAEPATLEEIENITPPDFEIKSEAISQLYVGESSMSLEGKTLEKGQTEKLTIKIKPTKPGLFNYQPTLIYRDEKKNKKFFRLNIPIMVSE